MALQLLIIDAANNVTCANKYPCWLDRTDTDRINDPLEAEGRKGEDMRGKQRWEREEGLRK